MSKESEDKNPQGLWGRIKGFWGKHKRKIIAASLFIVGTAMGGPGAGFALAGAYVAYQGYKEIKARGGFVSTIKGMLSSKSPQANEAEVKQEEMQQSKNIDAPEQSKSTEREREFITKHENPTFEKSVAEAATKTTEVKRGRVKSTPKIPRSRSGRRKFKESSRGI